MYAVRAQHKVVDTAGVADKHARGQFIIYGEHWYCRQCKHPLVLVMTHSHESNARTRAPIDFWRRRFFVVIRQAAQSWINYLIYTDVCDSKQGISSIRPPNTQRLMHIGYFIGYFWVYDKTPQYIGWAKCSSYMKLFGSHMGGLCLCSVFWWPLNEPTKMYSMTVLIRGHNPLWESAISRFYVIERKRRWNAEIAQLHTTNAHPHVLTSSHTSSHNRLF